MTRASGAGQMSLLDWEPPAPVRAFDDALVRAPTVPGRLARAIAVALADSSLSRTEIAAQMSEFLGARVSVNMINAYASQARDGHVISVPRFMALANATRDQRLVEMIAEPQGWAVVDRRFLLQIELAALHERQDELRKRGDTLRRLARMRGRS